MAAAAASDGSVLSIATVSQSLRFQAPAAWDVLRHLNLSVTFAAARDDWTEELATWGEFEDVRLSRSGHWAGNLAALWRLRSLLQRDWRLVQVQTPIAAALTRLALPRHRRYPLLYICHGLHFQRGDRGVKSASFRVAEGLLTRRTDGLALVSGEDLMWAKRHAGRRCRVFRLPGAGIDVERFSRAAVDRRGTARRLLFCGELNGNKDPLWAVDVAVGLRRTYPDLRLEMYGAGPLAPEIGRAAAQHPWITWQPFTADLASRLAATSVLLAPSYREGLPRVIVEALAAGVPVVARDNRGSRELLAGLGTVLSASATRRDWQLAIRRAIENPPSAGKMLERATDYSVASFSREYESMVLDLIAHPSGHRARRSRP